MSTRFGIAGCGNISRRHAASINRVGQLIAACDIISGKADLISKEFGGATYSSFDSLIASSPEVIAICTPNYLHASQSIAALEAGIHVLCEKPMALSVQDGLKMADAAKKNGRFLFIVKQNRFNPPVSWLSWAIKEGLLGAIHSFQINCFWNRPPSYYKESSWKGRAALDGGMLFTQFSHFIDLLYWLFGQPAAISGYEDNFLNAENIEGPDTGTVALKMKNGTIGSLNYTVTTHGQNMEGSVTVFGEKGTLKVGGPYLNELTWFDVEGTARPFFKDNTGPNLYPGYRGSMSNHHLVYDELIKALSGLPHILPSPNEALNTISIIEQINLAIKR